MPASAGRRPNSPGPPIGRHKELLADRAVRSWYDFRALRSRLSADNYLRQFGLLLERTKLDPAGIVLLAKKHPDRLRDLLVQDAANLKREGRLDSYVAKFFEGLRSYFRFHQVRFDGFPVLSAIRGASLANERVPTPEELGRVLERLSLRARVIALLMAHSGVRPGVLGSYGGEAGLRLEDLPELSLDGEPKLAEVPVLIRVPAALSKTRRAYITFGTSQLASTLLAYLAERSGRGEELGPKSPIVAASAMRGVAKTSRDAAMFSRGFLSTKAIAEELRGVLKATVPKGVTWRPYVLRSYCSTRLLLAEGQGRISRDLRESILGHDGGIASRYNVGKRWGEELLAEARREYANASEFLETNAQSRMNMAAEFRRTLLAVAGLNEEEMAKHMEDTNDEVLALVREKLRSKEAASSPPGSENGEGRRIQKPVPLAEARQLMAQGWTFVANFGPDEIILQPP